MARGKHQRSVAHRQASAEAALIDQMRADLIAAKRRIFEQNKELEGLRTSLVRFEHLDQRFDEAVAGVADIRTARAETEAAEAKKALTDLVRFLAVTPGKQWMMTPEQIAEFRRIIGNDLHAKFMGEFAGNGRSRGERRAFSYDSPGLVREVLKVMVDRP